MLECVVNLSEGRDPRVLEQLSVAAGDPLLDVHRDRSHHRSVFTLAGPPATVEAAARRLATWAVEHLDLRDHAGVHPRFGVVDVVPFIPLGAGGSAGADLPLGPAAAARDRFADWAGSELHLPCFLYGPLGAGEVRTLPEVRRRAFATLAPDRGPPEPDPTSGACAVGARHPLVAYNLSVADGDLALSRRVAGAVRGPKVRALAFDLEGTPQVSINLVEPQTVGPADVYDEVADRLRDGGARIAGAELVGLVPAAILEATPERRWVELGLTGQATIEGRLAERVRRR